MSPLDMDTRPFMVSLEIIGDCSVSKHKSDLAITSSHNLVRHSIGFFRVTGFLLTYEEQLTDLMHKARINVARSLQAQAHIYNV